MALSNRAKWVASIVLTLVMILIILLLTEAAVRVRHAMKYGDMPTVEDTFRVDQSIGLRVPVAGLEAGPIRINSLGFRGEEIPRDKPDNTLRIAFLGASTTYCAEVSGNDMTWPALVTEQLKERFPGRGFDYINGGVPGYSVASSIKNLKHRVAPLKPDVVVIYHATNDLAYETRQLAANAGIYEIPKQAGRSWLARQSLLWELVEKNLAIMAAQHSADSEAARLDFKPEQVGGEFGGDLDQLVKEAKQVAGRVILVTFAHQLRPEQSAEVQAKAAASALYYMPFMTPDALLRGYQRFNNIIRETAEGNHILLVDGEDAIPGDNEHFNDAVHFKDAGSQAQARRVVEAMLADPLTLKMLKGD
ncbi:MAG: SGNH/GDSL hydrolase family protein [Gammaproteobacteria bacterium]